MKTIRYSIALAAVLMFAPLAQAQTLIEGVYQSEPGENGRGACTLVVSSMGKSPKYGDDMYSLSSTGEGSCEWTAVGLSRNFRISAGMITSGGYDGYINARWPFGPGGSQLELVSYAGDGKLSSTQSFTRQAGLEK